MMLCSISQVPEHSVQSRDGTLSESTIKRPSVVPWGQRMTSGLFSIPRTPCSNVCTHLDFSGRVMCIFCKFWDKAAGVQSYTKITGFLSNATVLCVHFCTVYMWLKIIQNRREVLNSVSRTSCFWSLSSLPGIVSGLESKTSPEMGEILNDVRQLQLCAMELMGSSYREDSCGPGKSSVARNQRALY